MFLNAAAALPACSSLLVARSWEEPAYPNWTREFADKILSDSPWAKPLTVPITLPPLPEVKRNSFAQIELPPGIGLPRGGGGGGGGRTGRSPDSSNPFPIPSREGSNTGVRTEMYLTIRWASALPVRQAMTILEPGSAALDKEPSDYIIEIPGFLTTMFPKGATDLEEQLSRNARLLVKGRRPVSSSHVRVPEHGMHLMATMRFPRMEGLSAKDNVLHFVAQIGTAEIDAAFKLPAMAYRGRLEL